MFIRALARRWWLLALLGLTGLLIAYTAILTARVRYQSTVTLQLNPAARSAFLAYATEGSDASVSQLAASYSEVLRSRAFADAVVKHLGLRASPEAIAGSINAGLIQNTNILRLSVTSDRPDDAQQLAQGIAEFFVAETVPAQGAPSGTSSRIAEMEATARSYPGRIDALRQLRDRLDQTVGRGDLSRLTELNNLEVRLTTLESSYASLLVEINRARSAMNTASILDSATPAVPIGAISLMQALLFGLATGLSVGAGLALLLDSLDDTVRRPDDLVALWVIPPAAVVDHVPRGDREGPARGRLLLRDDTRPGAEALRILRANVRLAQPGARCRTLVVTSAADGEGKSFIACNLALAFAQANERVLLVDANLRSPSVQQAFGVTPEAGLQQAIDSIDARRWKAPTPNGNHARPLAERAARLSARAVPGARAVAADPVAADDSPIPGIVPSGVENLWLLVAAPTLSDPASVLGSTAAIQLMHELGRRWDIVILDTASLLPVADARLLAASADAVLVVARAGSTRRSALRSCIAMLEQAGRPPIGVVLNASAVEHPARRRKLRVLPEFR